MKVQWVVLDEQWMKIGLWHLVDKPSHLIKFIANK